MDTLNSLQLNSLQRRILEKCKSGRKVYITGKQETGKSTIIRAFYEWCKENDKVVNRTLDVTQLRKNDILVIDHFGRPIMERHQQDPDGEPSPELEDYRFNRQILQKIKRSPAQIVMVGYFDPKINFKNYFECVYYLVRHTINDQQVFFDYDSWDNSDDESSDEETDED